MTSIKARRISIILTLLAALALLSGCTPPSGRHCEVLTHLEVPFLACWYNGNAWW